MVGCFLLVKFEDWNLKFEATGGIYIERGGGVKGVRMGHTQFEGWGGHVWGCNM